MSQAALLMAVRDQLQELLGLDVNSCEVCFSGKPKPSCGELFVAVHPGPWRPDPDVGQGGDVGWGEILGCRVTVTRRLGYSPMDRWGVEVYLKPQDGMDALLRKIVAHLAATSNGDLENQTRYLVMSAANDYIVQRDGAGAGQFFEPLRLVDGGSLEEKGPEWFSAPPPDQDGGQYECGVSQTLQFGGARRLQGIGSVT